MEFAGPSRPNRLLADGSYASSVHPPA